MSRRKYIFYSISSLFLVVMLPLFIVGCKDDDPPAPKPVEEKNYWSDAPCKIDGKPWGDCFPGFMNESRTSGN